MKPQLPFSMQDAILTLCHALAQILNVHYNSHDRETPFNRETAKLMIALADYINKYQK